MNLDALNQRHQELVEHELQLQQTPFVFGEGRLEPVIMLVGEAPGAQEVLQGRPFVGKAGQNLAHFLQQLQLDRSALYISNVVKIRPHRVGATGRLSNRPPTRTEIAAFLPWLSEEISHVSPRLIVTLGNTALQAIVGPVAVIGEVHGQLISRQGMPAVFPLYHPAAIIYNRALQATYDEDLVRLNGLLVEWQVHR